MSLQLQPNQVNADADLNMLLGESYGLGGEELLLDD